MKTIATALLALTVVAAPAFAISPALRGIAPVGGQRGSDVEVKITGQRLADAQEILFYQPGITVKSLKAGKDAEVVAVLHIAPDAELGLHDFRLRTATGISTLKTFSVGALPDVAEKEPNNDFAKPQAIRMNVTVNGIADREDIDYYAVKAKKGERITAEVEGIRLGLTLFDPYVAILDSKRFEMKSSDDSALIWQDGFVSLIAPEDGTYVVAVREAAYAGNAQCLYRLHVGTFPRPTATMPSGGKIGTETSVRWIGDVLGERTTRVKLPNSVERNFGLLAQDDKGVAPYPNVFRLSPYDNVIEAEPNNTPEKATRFAPPMAVNGIIETAGDVDYFTFPAKKGETFEVLVVARQIRSPLDSVLTITDDKGRRLGSNDDNRGPDSRVPFKAPRDGVYRLSVTDHLKKGGPDYTYRIEFNPVITQLTASTPNESLRRGTGTMAIAVPKGNHQAILINAAREGFGGELAFSAADLPPGVTIAMENMTAGNTTLPLLFSADAKAPVGGSLARIVGKPVDSKLDVPYEFVSTAELVLGQNNIPFWTRTVDKLAVAVTEEAPYSLEIVEPRVPIVRGGSMELKVVAKRKPGFKAPIAIQLPWNPPGISSKADTIIPEGKDSATILVNASGGAPTAAWKVTVNGTYTEPPPAGTPQTPGNRRGFGRGRLTVSSPFATLKVAPQYLTLKFAPASVEQGKDTTIAVKVNQSTPFPGEAKVTLIGLPNKVTTESATITKETDELVFKIRTDPTSPAGEAKNLFCQVVVMQDGEPITHQLGTGRLRIDAPLVKKGAPAGAKGGSKSQLASSAKPGAAPLSRLEKLRQESKERSKASTPETAKNP